MCKMSYLKLLKDVLNTLQNKYIIYIIKNALQVKEYQSI